MTCYADRAEFLGLLEGRPSRDPWVGEVLRRACENEVVGLLGADGLVVSYATVTRGQVLEATLGSREIRVVPVRGQ